MECCYWLWPCFLDPAVSVLGVHSCCCSRTAACHDLGDNFLFPAPRFCPQVQEQSIYRRGFTSANLGMFSLQSSGVTTRSAQDPPPRDRRMISYTWSNPLCIMGPGFTSRLWPGLHLGGGQFASHQAPDCSHLLELDKKDQKLEDEATKDEHPLVVGCGNIFRSDRNKARWGERFTVFSAVNIAPPCKSYRSKYVY